MRKTVAAVALSIATGFSLLVSAQGAAAPQAASCTFSPTSVLAASSYTAEQKSAPFSTQKPANHIAVLDGFSQISPLVRQQNLAEAVVINNTASPETARYAVKDNYALEGPRIFNALGSSLAQAFSGALDAGQLPKTAELLLGDGSLVGARLGTSAEKEHFKNPRPFEVAPQLIRHYSDGRPDLYEAVRGSGSYPSGHTTWGYAQAYLIATLLPELGPQILARGAEYGYHRVVLGVHYPLDVIGGRIQAEATVSELLGDSRFTPLLAEAKKEIRTVLAARVGAPIAKVVACQQLYQTTGAALTSYRQRATFSFQLAANDARAAQIPAGAENLIRAAHPGLADQQLRAILAKTALPAGYPLDKNGPDGGWQRLDIARAWVTR